MAEKRATRQARQPAAPEATGQKARRTKVGRVASNRMEKTVVVEVEQVTRHTLYGRTMRRTRKFKAHDERNACVVGDTVVIAESRPLSKDKHWVVQEVLRRGTGEAIQITETEA